jgi:hypothetical protein
VNKEVLAEAPVVQRSLPLPPERPTETPLEAAARSSLEATPRALTPAEQEAMDRLRRISRGPQFGAPGDADIPF